MPIRSRLSALVLAAAAALLLCGCGSAAPTADAPAAADQAAGSITISDSWVKAAEDGMTSTFAVLKNSGREDAQVVAVSSDASATTELHETVEDANGQTVMQRVEGGFTIPAEDRFEFTPAGNHLMLMDLAAPLTAGQQVAFILEFSDGSTLEFSAVVKDYAGANENYVPDSADEHAGMDMGEEE